ncbi:MAG TPA: exodeoxyribonuclease VII small subunit, partial [Candidatus Limnocylindrales bacterium]|nr:exodeoxyribonuclease VII small subunit [Candidatus Limnocylindrales bacterium]
MTGPTETQPIEETSPPIEETAPPIEDLSFDDALAELQRTIAELESGNLPLERTLALHERGAA